MKSLSDGVNSKEVLKLMAGMRQHGVQYLEVGGLKLSLAPEVRKEAPATTIGPIKPGDTARAFAYVQQARQEAELQRKAVAAAKMGGVGVPPIAKLANDVYETAMETKGM